LKETFRKGTFETVTDSRRPLDDVPLVDDPRSLRALAHPIRIALVEQLTMRGPLTATEAGERIGESPSTCSFHLRQLAKYGFVEEAGERPGRSRPWRMTRLGMRLDNETGAAETRVASSVLARMLRERQLDRYRRWLETQDGYPAEWRRAAEDSEFVFWLTAEELAALGSELVDLLLPRFRERLTDPSARPAGALPVEMLVLGYPIEAPEARP
jgi:DNA-binding transcriptional ArsR family regulator